MAENDELVDITYASEKLGVSKLTLRNWDNSGKLKAVRIGNRGDRRYKKQDIESLINPSENTDKEIDKEDFFKYLDNNHFWIQEGPGLPLTVELATKEMIGFGKHFTPGITYCIIPGEKDYFKQVMSVEETLANCHAQFETLKKEPKKISEYIKKCDETFKILEKVVIRLDFINFEKLSNKELLEEFAKFNEALSKFWVYSLFVEPYDPYIDRVYLPKFEKLIKDKSKARESFSILTLPLELSFVAKQHLDLIKIIFKFMNNKERNILSSSKNPDYLADITFRNPELLKALTEHQQKHHWTQSSYASAEPLTIDDFLGFIREIILEKSEKVSQEYDKLENQQKELSKKQEKLINELKLSKETVIEIEHIRKATELKDERKRMILMMLNPFFRFIEEFAKRANIDYRLIGYASIVDIPKILEKNFNIEILQQRRDSGVMVAGKNNQFTKFVGNDASIIKSKILPEQSTLNSIELHGNTASRGGKDSIIGKVRIILEPKEKTIKDDEILVTSMTRPDFVPLMKKAAAVITDEGGITCHAAIVARELNKPCIIGTQNASKVLKDGDEVELRLNHGVVKILKKTN